MDLHSTYPGIDDLKWRARCRLPKFVWEYLASGTGREATLWRNRSALDRVGFLPRVLRGPQAADLSCRFLGTDYPLPFGVAPVGMSGLIWPGAEQMLAASAAKAGIPYCLSTVASQSPEDMTGHIGPQAWFQLYPPQDPAMRQDLLDRVRDAGFKTLVLTVDVPVASRRERQVRSGLTHPPRLTPRLLGQIALRPAWALAMARSGMPRMRTLDKYAQSNANLPPTAHIGYLLRTAPDMSYVQWLRDHWDGKLIVKGILDPDAAKPLEQAGVDALWVSSHAGRQFDGAPGAAEMLPEIRKVTRLPLVFDSGIESGLDVLRALTLGADFVMLGRAFHYGIAALGAAGSDHVTDILHQDMTSNMGQLGAATLADLPPIRRVDIPPAHEPD